MANHSKLEGLGEQRNLSELKRLKETMCTDKQAEDTLTDLRRMTKCEFRKNRGTFDEMVNVS